MSMISLIKQAAIEAVEQNSPTSITYGEVTSVNPLEINIDQKFSISKEFIFLTSNVIDKETEITIDDGIKNKAVIFDGLKEGDEVLLLRAQGGQKYIILDRLVRV